MNRQKLVRFAVLGALAIAALAAAGYAFGGGGDDSSPLGTSFVGEGSDGDSAVGLPEEAYRASVDDVVKTIAATPSLAQLAETGAVGGGASAPSDQSLPSLQTDGRKIVSTAALNLQVDDVGASFEEVSRVANSAGGFVASSSFAYRNEDQIASMTIRVPSNRYQDVLSQLRGLGVKVVSEDSSANDVTEEYTDLNSRLRNLEATETQLLTLLGRANDIGDILMVQDRLNDVRGQIEQVKGRMQLLDNLTDLATISVHLEPVVVGKVTSDNGTNLGDEVNKAWDDSLAFLTDIAAGVVRVVVFAWWVPIFALPLGLLGWLLLRNRPRPLEAAD